MKREAKLLLDKAIDSFLLSVEHFNSPWECGRHESVLLLLDRAFELALKAAIVHRGGRIREPGRSANTIGFDKCVRRCVTDARVKCLTEEQALTLQTINQLRDSAQHYLLDISEQQLYLYAQAGATLLDEFLKAVFAVHLSERLPERVLPISTNPPRDLHSLVDIEFEEIRKLVAPKSRQRLAAHAKLRALAIIEASLRGERSQPPEAELETLVKQIQQKRTWQELFPGVASLQLDTSGSGLTVTIRIGKKEGESVRLVPEGTPDATVVAVHKINETSFYSLGLKDLAKKLGLSEPKTLAVVKALGIQKQAELFREITLGKSKFKRYSHLALEKLQKELPTLDIAAIWAAHSPPGKKRTP